MNSETAATHTAEYTALPANWKPICPKCKHIFTCKQELAEKYVYVTVKLSGQKENKDIMKKKTEDEHIFNNAY